MYIGKMHDGIMCNTILKFSFFSSVVTVTKAVAPEPYPFLTLLFCCSTCIMPGLQLARLACPSPSPGICSNSCPLSQWCHPTILSSVTHFSSCPQSFPASGSSPMSWLFVSGGQSIGASISISVLPKNTQQLISFRIDLLDLLTVQGILKRLLQHHSSKESILQCSAFFIIQFSYPYMTTGKTIALL